MSSEPGTLTAQQQAALSAIYWLMRELERWPPFASVDHELDRQGIDAGPALLPLRGRYVLFDPRLHPSTEVALSAAGVLVAGDDGAADAAGFWQLVQLGLSAQSAFRPDPAHPEVQPAVTHIDAQTDTSGDAIPDSVALRAFLILQAEGISGGSSGPGAAGEWRFEVGRDFRRWRNVHDLDEFITARTTERLELQASTAAVASPIPMAAAAPSPDGWHTPSGPTVFLCHSSGDKQAVRQLDERLRTDGYATWLDERELLPGHDWEREIRRAVREADVVVVCLSHDSITKRGFVQKEIRLVLDVADEQPEGAVFVVPARLEECSVPERLRRWQWVDLFSPHGYDRLRGTLDALDARGPRHAPTKARPDARPIPMLEGVATNPQPSARHARPVVIPKGGSGGPTATRVQHNYIVRNAGDVPTTELSLWIVDGEGRVVSTRAGGRVVLAPGEVAHMTLEVAQPLPDEQELHMSGRDQNGEHTESTGILPPKHM